MYSAFCSGDSSGASTKSLGSCCDLFMGGIRITFAGGRGEGLGVGCEEVGGPESSLSGGGDILSGLDGSCTSSDIV